MFEKFNNKKISLRKKIKTLKEFAELSTDELIGTYDEKQGKRYKIELNDNYQILRSLKKVLRAWKNKIIGVIEL